MINVFSREFSRKSPLHSWLLYCEQQKSTFQYNTIGVSSLAEWVVLALLTCTRTVCINSYILNLLYFNT